MTHVWYLTRNHGANVYALAYAQYERHVQFLIPIAATGGLQWQKNPKSKHWNGGIGLSTCILKTCKVTKYNACHTLELRGWATEDVC